MRMRSQGLAAILVSLALAASPAQGQTAQPFSIQGSLLLVIPSGNAFTETKAGPGFELQIRRTVSAWSFGGGIQYSRHDIGATDPLVLVGAFFEPRYVLPVSARYVRPYVSGRIALFQQRFSSEGVSGSATGAQVNGGGGVLIRLNRQVNADLGATVGYLRFGRYTASFGGTELTAEGGSGINTVLRAGLAIGIGR